MSRYVIDQDQRRCIGCHACEVHCKAAHDAPVGPRSCRIISVGPKDVGGIPRQSFVFMPCFHCEQPWCVAACPTGAMQRRAQDGIVFVEEARCVGCRSCMTACPWGAPQWDGARGKVVKCDACKDRVDRGLAPACVTKCTARALHWTTPEEASARKREQRAPGLADLGG
jgi:Fe-S-cluster-containing dehydrogenase component